MAHPETGLVGRDTELHVMAGLLADVLAGRGGAVLVEGEPGIGKSALLEAALAGAEAQDCQVLRGACDDLMRRFPLGAMLNALGVQEGSADPGHQAAAGQTLFKPGNNDGLGALLAAGDPVMAAVEQLVGLVDRLCADRPVVLVVEDLHWADEASLVLWHRLLRATAQLPLLLAASCRPVPAPTQLNRLRDELRRTPTGLITLGGLSAPDVARLAHRLAGRPPSERLAERLASASGNPLYVRELFDVLARSGALREEAGTVDVDDTVAAHPAALSLSSVILERMDSLTAETRQILLTAALLGPAFTAGDLAVVAGRAPTCFVGAIGEAVAAGVVESAGAQLRFRHSLLRQALYESVPLALRVALHQQAISALIAAHAPAERVAELLLPVLAEADGWELGWIVEHGDTLMYRAPEAAAELLGHALGRLTPGDSRRARVQDALLLVSYGLGRYEDTEKIAHDILTGGADRTRSGRALFLLVRKHFQSGTVEEGLKVVADALDGDRVSVLWRARLTAVRSTLLWAVGSGRSQEARDEALSARVEGERLSDRYTVGQALHTLSLLSLGENDLGTACDMADRALEVMAEDRDMMDLRLLVGTNRFAWLADQDRTVEAERGARHVLALAEECWPVRFGSIRVRVGETAYWQGRWDDAQAELEQAAESTKGVQVNAVRLAYQAQIAGHRDDWESAFTHLKVLAGPDYATEWVVSGPVVEARVLEAQRAGAAQIIETLAPHLLNGSPTLVGWQVLFPDLARAARQHADERTLRAVDELGRNPVSIGITPLWRACLIWASGLIAEDPGPVLSAAEYLRTAQRLPRLGAALEDAAVLQAAAGDLASARGTLAEALETYAGLGAVWDTRRALARIRRYGVQPGARGAKRRPKTGWAALTDTEVRVAHFVARGMSNSDIAGRLQLSRRTVETHVSHILMKLQARSRREVAEHAGAMHNPGAAPSR
jgi:DNA-binding CsgD family transcriptional regulator